MTNAVKYLRCRPQGDVLCSILKVLSKDFPRSEWKISNGVALLNAFQNVAVFLTIKVLEISLAFAYISFRRSSILETVDIDLQKSVRAFAAGLINLLVDVVG